MNKPAQSLVEACLSKKVKEAGFTGRGRRFMKELAECSVEVEVQRSRFGAQQHFVNVEVTYSRAACARAGVREGAGILCRAESIPAAEKEAFLEALDDGSALPEEVRIARLEQLVDEVLSPFLDAVSTIDGARKLYVDNRLDQMAFAALKERWTQSG